MTQFGASLTDDSRVIIYDPNIFILDNLKVPRHPSFLLKIKIKQPYSTYLYLFRSLSPSFYLSLPLSISPSLFLSLSLSLSVTDWLNEEHLEHACNFCLARACSKHSSFSQSVSQHARLYYIYYMPLIVLNIENGKIVETVDQWTML